MEKILEVSEEEVRRRRNEQDGRFESKYDDETMPAKTYQLLRAGKSQAQLALEFKVTTRTLQNWKNPNTTFYKPNFAAAYEEGETANIAWWDERAQDQIIHPTEHFDSTLYVIERKRRHGAADSRTLNLPDLVKAKTYTEQAEAIKQQLARGEITPDEAQKIAHTLEKLARISDFEEILAEQRRIKKFIDEYENGKKTHSKCT